MTNVIPFPSHRCTQRQDMLRAMAEAGVMPLADYVSIPQAMSNTADGTSAVQYSTPRPHFLPSRSASRVPTCTHIPPWRTHLGGLGQLLRAVFLSRGRG
jgi:hypothetical protein